MAPAISGMQAAFNRANFNNAAIPVVANTTARATTTPTDIKDELIAQITHCVQWQKSIEYMLAQGINTFIEMGPGRVLTGCVRRISREAKIFNISDLKTVKITL
jgi:[acyl-carrier-protein] S-malonyltransferase